MSASISRRGLIAGGGAVTAIALAGPGRGLLGLIGWGDDEQAALERSSMERNLTERFELMGGEHAGATLQLISVEQLPQTVVSNPEGQFAARFTATGGLGLAQATYRMASRRFGEIDLFVSPIHDDGAESDLYEALFNRPAEVAS